MSGSETAWTREKPARRLVGVSRCIVRLLPLLLAVAFQPAGVRAAHDTADSSRRAGDDPRWAAADWDDRDWQRGNEVPTRAGIYWVRYRVELHDGKQLRMLDTLAPVTPILDVAARPECLYLAPPCSYAAYWGGRLVGRSGVVGRTREEEQVGPLDNYFAFSSELTTPGPHVVALHLSSFHLNFPA